MEGPFPILSSSKAKLKIDQKNPLQPFLLVQNATSSERILFPVAEDTGSIHLQTRLTELHEIMKKIKKAIILSVSFRLFLGARCAGYSGRFSCLCNKPVWDSHHDFASQRDWTFSKIAACAKFENQYLIGFLNDNFLNARVTWITNFTKKKLIYLFLLVSVYNP